MSSFEEYQRGLYVLQTLFLPHQMSDFAPMNASPQNGRHRFQDDGTVVGLDDPDGVALQVSNMVRDAIKPDVTMFLRYTTIDVQDKKIVAIDIQQGTERPYYIAKKGLRPEGVYVRQGYSSVPATNTMIRRMIKETPSGSSSPTTVQSS